MGRHGLLRLAGGALAAAVLVGFGFSVAGQAAPLPRPADTRPNAIPVDVELVLAVDVSYSMDPDEQALQRDGYRLALTSKEFLQALREGAHGKIAVTYIEWAGQYDQQVVVPWRLIEGPESADAVAAEIARAPYRRASRTSISGGLAFAQGLFATSGYRGLRRVIDVSGDGPNNSGMPVAPVRDVIVNKGIVINGLPLMLKRPYRGMMDIAHLDWYYEDCVTGGPGSFRHPGARARAVRGSDAQQAGTGSRRTDAESPRHPRVRRTPARVLPDWRDAVAAALGCSG